MYARYLETGEDTHLKEEALDRIKWRNRFGRGCGQITDDDDDDDESTYCSVFMSR
jgi:hypothetical protein